MPMGLQPQKQKKREAFCVDDSRRRLVFSFENSAPLASIRCAARNDFINENWDRISQGSASISAKDLEAYARSAGLPTSYISMFLESAGATDQINRNQFQAFVQSHESALRRAFQLFDKDGDGKIGVEDLESSLVHVAVSCCRTRCIYRAPRCLAHKLLAQTQVAGKTDGREVDFAAFRRFFMLLPRTEMALEFWLRAGAAIDCSEKRPPMALDGDTMHKASAWGHLFAGAVAGAASRTATAPLETLRLAIMTGSMQACTLQQAASNIVQAHGVRGLYRGNGLNVLRSAPQKALDFFAFDGFKRLLKKLSPGESNKEQHPNPQDANPLHTFTAAGLGGATSWALLYPLETLRSRVTTGAAAAPEGLRGLVELLRNIAAREGLGGLYRGLGWSMAGIFPEAAMCYGLHDFLKHCHSRANGGVEVGVGTSLCFGVVSAFAGQLLAYPLETIARRLQLQQGPGGLQAVLRQIMAEGGPKALYRGLGAATLRLVPMAGVSFGTYELVRCGLLALEEKSEEREANKEYEELHRCCMAHQEQCAKVGLVYRPMECVPLLDEAGGQVEMEKYCLPSVEAESRGFCGQQQPHLAAQHVQQQKGGGCGSGKHEEGHENSCG